MVASEKKRLREKNCRSEMNGSLDTLSGLVYKIEPSLVSGRDEAASRIVHSSSNLFNRSDLLRCSAQLLQQLHTKENEERKVVIQELERQHQPRSQQLLQRMATTPPQPFTVGPWHLPPVGAGTTIQTPGGGDARFSMLKNSTSLISSNEVATRPDNQATLLQ